jgi:hypothetical protein
MPNANDELGQLSLRIARLERQNRRLKLGALSIAAITAFGLTLGAAPNKEPRIIEAEGFIMRDANGIPRVEIGKDGFYVNDDDGKHRIAFYAHAGKDGETGIRLLAEDDNKKQITLFVKKNSDAPTGIHINDSNGKTRAVMAVGGFAPKEKPSLFLQDENGNVFFSQSQQ